VTPADCIAINEADAARLEQDAAELQRGDMDDRRSARQFRMAALALRLAAQRMRDQVAREIMLEPFSLGPQIAAGGVKR
jgi:hypothetical protein